MAITIVKQVGASTYSFAPAYNENIFIVSSTNYLQDNFKFVADIYSPAISGYIRLTAPKHPTYNTGVFDVGRIVENYVTSNIDKSLYSFQKNAESNVPYYVRFGEEYGASHTVYPNLTDSYSTCAWNAHFDFFEFKDWVQTPYVFADSTVRQLLTNKPITVDIRDTEDAWLYLINSVANVVKEARIRTYDSAGSLIQTAFITNEFNTKLDTSYYFQRFGCGTSNLNLIPSSGITFGAQPLITASVKTYDVTFVNSSSGVVSTPQVFNINNVCTKNETYRFHFLNKLGGFDSFTFFRGSQKTSSITRSSYNSKIGGVTGAATYGYSYSTRGKTDYNINIIDNIKVQSDWISEETNNWLEELITSPEVYLDHSTYGLVSVNILNSSFEFKQEVKEKLFNLTIEFKYSFERTRQRK